MTGTKDRLKPWEPLPTVSCERCVRQAVYRVAAGAEPDFEQVAGNEGSITLREDLTSTALACEIHVSELMDDLSTMWGAGADPLRHTWRTWVYCETRIADPYWWIRERVQTWRFHRALEGKRFGCKFTVYPVEDESGY
jgi:hypothetical protein